MDASLKVTFSHRLTILLSKYWIFLSVVMFYCFKIIIVAISIYKISLINVCPVLFFQAFTFKFSTFLYLMYVSFKKHMVGLFLTCAVNLSF